MKKKRQQKSEEEASSSQAADYVVGQAADYVVGQVAGSLFRKDSAAPGSLCALFSAAPQPAPLLFQPAPKPVQKSTEVTEQRETPEVKGHAVQKHTKPQKQKTPADQKLENRESGLQNADEEESGKKPPRPLKRKAADQGEGGALTGAERRIKRFQETKAQAEEEALKRKRTVFVGNLPVSCTKKTLRSLFREGNIESIRFRSVVREDPSISRKLAAIQRKVHPKKQSINAYVVFKDEEGVAKALERNGMEIEKDFHIRVDRVAENSSHDHKRSIFVGNLSFEMKELSLRQHFEPCGRVEAVRLVRDQNSGLGKGFGYVLFESADSVQLALKLEGSSLEGRPLRVKRSVKKEKVKNKARGPAGPPQGPRGGRGETKGPGWERGPRRGAARGAGRNQTMPTNSSSFRGEMADPSKKNKKKGLKKKQKPKKTVHI